MHATTTVHRRVFEYEALRDMRSATFTAEAFATVADLEGGRNPITSVHGAGRAAKWLFTFAIPTLSGPGTFAPRTVIGVDTETTDYPLNPPSTWVISRPVPWSPHFKLNQPVCIGSELWAHRRGHITLGHLAVHIARMLNWDEKGRGAGYRGWNGPAIDYHRRHYGERPLDPNVVYPSLPSWLTPAASAAPPRFELVTQTAPELGRIRWS